MEGNKPLKILACGGLFILALLKFLKNQHNKCQAISNVSLHFPKNLYCFWQNLLKNFLRLQRAFFGLLLLTTVILWFRQMNWHCVEGDMSKNNNLGIPCWNWIFYNLFLPWEQNFHLTWFWTLLFIGCIPPVPATPILSTPKKERSQMEIGKKCGDPQKSEFSSTKLS